MRQAKNFYHRLSAIAANILFGFPGRKLSVIGVTGTDGKTTTVSLIAHILRTAGYKTEVQSTLSSPHTTTPDCWTTQRFLARCLGQGVTHVVLEVTSHAIDQHRVWGIPFKIGVLTNITDEEHLDYHRSFAHYRATKLRFLANCPTVVVKADDPVPDELRIMTQESRVVAYGLKSKVKFQATKIKYDGSGVQFSVRGETFRTRLMGEFNVYNALAAIATVKNLGIPDAVVKEALDSFTPPPGRLEIVTRKPFITIVDFAHTPEAFRQVLPVARSLLRNNGRLIHVFGATGDRYAGKRPLLAKIACQYDDLIILTHEDTYSEDIKAIVDQVESGLDLDHFKYSNNRNKQPATGRKYYWKTYDRKEALAVAVSQARAGDVVILTGLGHQKTMNIGGKEVAWSDGQEVLNLLIKK